MFELFHAYNDIIHLGEWTGLGVGGLIACAGLGYASLKFPPLRHVAIVGAVAVATAWAGGIHMGGVERRDVLAQWDAAKKAAAAAVIVRDDSAAKITAATFDPIAAILAKDETGRQLQVDKNAKAFSAGNCRIGPDALRLRGEPKPKPR